MTTGEQLFTVTNKSQKKIVKRLLREMFWKRGILQRKHSWRIMYSASNFRQITHCHENFPRNISNCFKDLFHKNLKIISSSSDGFMNSSVVSSSHKFPLLCTCSLAPDFSWPFKWSRPNLFSFFGSFCLKYTEQVFKVSYYKSPFPFPRTSFKKRNLKQHAVCYDWSYYEK